MILKFEDICIDKEFEDLLPVLTLDEYERLKQNILKNGVLDPLKVWQDPEKDDNNWILIDGHNRYNIMKKNDIEFDIFHGFKIMYEEELPTREAVKQWMLEQQLGRRNLSEVDRYNIVQKFKSLFENKAKENQSLGGKGLPNLVKVNVQEEIAKATGISKGSYYKLDKVMKSDNEEVKQQLREKKVSIDKAYRELKNPILKKIEAISPQQQIEKFDNRMNDIDKEISSLKTERESLIRSRSSLFEALDIPCELKYELENETLCRSCSFYIEVDGHRQEFVNCMVIDDEPYSLFKNRVPEKYKSDFIMLYREAHFEDMERTRQENERLSRECKKEYENNLINDTVGTIDKDFCKKCFHILAKKFHPDNGEEGNMDDMKSLNQLKVTLGI